MTDALPSFDCPVIPIKIKPTCAIEEKARKRFMFCCRNANKFPMIIVSTEIRNNILYQISSIVMNTLFNTETNTNMIAPLEITDR